MCCVFQDYYDYWDRFVDEWNKFIITESNTSINKWSDTMIKNYPHLTQWKYPDIKKNTAINELPNPWWGACCCESCGNLKAVVLNYNPLGSGSEDVKNPLGTSKYSSYVKKSVGEFINGIKQPTSEWHYNKRVKPVFKAIGKHGKREKEELKQILSIDLVPWCTPNISHIYKYVACNRKIIFEKVICFAAKASEQVADTLKNIVLVRMTSSNFKNFLGGIGGFNYVMEEVEEADLKYCIYEFTQIPKAKFVCVWSNSRNNFPKKLNIVIDKIKELREQNKL